jgi:hypothetical protein
VGVVFFPYAYYAPIGCGGTWNRAGVIVFAPDGGVALSRVAAAGGVVTRVTGFEPLLATTMSYRWPVLLPYGKHFLYTSVDFGADQDETSTALVANRDARAGVTHSYLAGYGLTLQVTGACTDWTTKAENYQPNCLILGRFAEKQGSNRFGR